MRFDITEGSNTVVNVELLKDKVDDSGMTVTAICEKTGMLKQTYYSRLKNPRYTIYEVDALRKVLHLTAADVRRIFFASDVNFNSTK